MDRRAFNKLVCFGAAGNLGVSAKPLAEASSLSNDYDPPVTYPQGVYHRLLVDTHIPDWDPRLLARFDAADYVYTIISAGFQSVMQYSKSLVGLCLWRTKVGHMHANMKDRDFFGEVMEQCKRRGLHRVGYYGVIYDSWAFANYPDWRIVPENGCDPILETRTGVVCPNSPYRERALAEVRELVTNYDFEAIFVDMMFWPYVCYCPYCTERFRKECNAEPPRVINWEDPTWRKFQKARQQWILEFAMAVTKTIKDVRPIPVSLQYATFPLDWRFGAPLELRDACDYVGGDFYGGPTQYSFVCKAYHGLTRMRPFEFMTTRTIDLNDFETTKPLNELLISSSVATAHSGANLIIDAFNPDGTLNPDVYKYLGKQNSMRVPFDPFLGGDMLADVALYYDKESMYDPAENGLHVAGRSAEEMDPSGKAPHMSGVVGAARILREAHIPFGVVTNVSLDQLSQFRAVIVSNVFEMTAQQAAQFRDFVEKGGVLYASGPSSLDRFHPDGPRFLLEDVLGTRYRGTLGTTWTYLSPQDSELKQSIWPQDALSFPGQMIHAETLPGADVLATVTLPWEDPKVGNCINLRFAQTWSNPPAPTAGDAPGIVIHPFGRGKAIWIAAQIEAGENAVNAKVVSSLLQRVLPGPYHFEVDTHESVEMTLFHQAEKQRLLVSLLKMEWRLTPIGLGATVRVQLPSSKKATGVLRVPERKEIQFRSAGPYVEFRIEPFETLAMALVEYA